MQAQNHSVKQETLNSIKTSLSQINDQWRDTYPLYTRIMGIHPLRASIEWMHLFVEAKQTLQTMQEIHSLPKGKGEAVVIMPIFPWASFTCQLLEIFLKQLGYCVHTVKLPWYTLTYQQSYKLLQRKLKSLAAQEGPLMLVGHSISGLYGKKFAEKYPELIKKAILLGTPDTDIKTKTQWYESPNTSRNTQIIPTYLFDKDKDPSQTPAQTNITHFWSRYDGFVSPLQKSQSSKMEKIEVRSSHLGMVVNWNVFRQLAVTLAQQD